MADTGIIENGPRAEIVIADRPPRMVVLAANELQAALKAVAGAELPMVTEPNANVAVKLFAGRSDSTQALHGDHPASVPFTAG